MAASVEPITVPVPPRIETPPITEAVMTVSSRLGGTVDWITCSWVANRIAGDAGEEPVQREDADDRALGIDARGARRLHVAADRIDGAAEVGVAHEERGERWSAPP